MPRRLSGLMVAVLLLVAGLGSPARAQTAGTDLTLPPEWRGAEAPPAAKAAPPRSSDHHSAAQDAMGPRGRPRQTAEHPVDLGVAVKGGSATPRVYGGVGTSQAIRESGTGFGAGMRVGF